jgi:hypothetical protein
MGRPFVQGAALNAEAQRRRDFDRYPLRLCVSAFKLHLLWPDNIHSGNALFLIVDREAEMGYHLG